jgi:hypothetical protein
MAAIQGAWDFLKAAAQIAWEILKYILKDLGIRVLELLRFIAMLGVGAMNVFKAIGGFINDYFITPLENAWNTLKKIIDNLPSLDGVKDFLGGRYEQFFTPITPQLAGAGAGGSKTLEIGKIDIHTQATNADGDKPRPASLRKASPFIILVKSHISAYTKKDGTFVAPP